MDKCNKAGLSEEQVDKIRQIPNGEKEEPLNYLEKNYIDNHLDKFRDTGCYKIISDKLGEPKGTIGEDGVFVLSGQEMNQLLKDANGDPRKLEESLSMQKGYLGDNPYLIRADDPQNLRMSTGNEPNAWQNEWCPCGTTRGGCDEAVTDSMESGDYSFKHCFSAEDWRR